MPHFVCALALMAGAAGLHLDPRWRLLDLWNNIGLVGCACIGIGEEFGVTQPTLYPRPQPAIVEAALVLVGVCVVCLIYLNRRTRGVEIVK